MNRIDELIKIRAEERELGSYEAYELLDLLVTERKASRPNWDDLPDWVQYVAQNDDGGWRKFKKEPIFVVWRWENYGINEDAERIKIIKDCKSTLEKRPDKYSILYKEMCTPNKVIMGLPQELTIEWPDTTTSDGTKKVKYVREET